MSYMDLANAQLALDRDRENVEATARKLYTYCAALRERIQRYYGCMATAEKWAGLMEQAQKCAGLMPILTDFIEYFQDGDKSDGPWSSIDSVPEWDRDLTDEDRAGIKARCNAKLPPLGDVVGAMSEMNDLIQKGGDHA